MVITVRLTTKKLYVKQDRWGYQTQTQKHRQIRGRSNNTSIYYRFQTLFNIMGVWKLRGIVHNEFFATCCNHFKRRTIQFFLLLQLMKIKSITYPCTEQLGQWQLRLCRIPVPTAAETRPYATIPRIRIWIQLPAHHWGKGCYSLWLVNS